MLPPQVEMPEAVIPQLVPTFLPVGMDKHTALSRLPQGASRLVRNLTIRDNAYTLRDATRVLGAAATGDLVHATELILTTDLSYPVRFATNGVEVYEGGAWAATSGTAWTTTDAAPFSLTGWRDRLIFSNGSTGIYELAFTAGFPKTVLNVTSGVIHLSTNFGRVIASTVDRIFWSVKYNHTDWAGIGSGYEDLQSAPGGQPDLQTAVIPVTGEYSIVVRSASFWIMTQTGNVDAPFSFSLMSSGQGSRYPRTCVGVQRGVIALGDSGAVWLVTLDGQVRDVGRQIRSELANLPIAQLRRAVATYDPKNNEYRLSVPRGATNTDIVYRLNLDTLGWTEDQYPFPIRSISYALFSQSVSVNELTGTVDDLTGVVDDLGGDGSRRTQMLFAMAGAPRYVVQEMPSANVSLERDASISGGTTASGFRLETAGIRRGGVYTRNHALELLLEYITETECPILFEYSSDGGASWTTITAATLNAARFAPEIHPVRLSFDREELQFAVSSTQPLGTVLLGMAVVMAEGGGRADA